uniref:Cytochrome c oxidase subunit 1 n=1 Tax=Rhynchopus euleeides TaxID=630703 RepID=A0A2D2AK22_9EUGL|nr:cytochrome c oxidase subunit 1 [Rhynchopus euleeides]
MSVVPAIAWTTNAKVVGCMYLGAALSFGASGMLLSWVLRGEIGGLGEQLLFGDHHLYNVLITSHAMLMLFFFIMPAAMSGLGNLLLPVQLSTPEMMYPKVNNLGAWLLLNGYLLIIGSSWVDEGVGTAWTVYPPLSTGSTHGGTSMEVFIVSLHAAGLSSLTGAINVVSTCYYTKRASSTLLHASLYPWALLITAALLIGVIPILAGAITMLLSDRGCSTSYYDVVAGGDPIMYQHLFWVFGHPEVYIIILPVFGIVSHTIHRTAVFSVYNMLGMIYAMLSIAIVGYFVWAHHMFSIGMDVDSRVYFSSATLLIALPTSVKVFTWCTGIRRTSVATGSVWYVITFLLMFLLGGVTGLVLANSEVDLSLHDTYYVVAHFHYVLSLGAVYGMLTGLLSVHVLLLGGDIGAMHARMQLGIMLIGTTAIFWSMHLSGSSGLPRRMPDTPDTYMQYVVTPTVGIYLVLVAIALHGIGAMESVVLESTHARNTISYTSTSGMHISSTTPLPNSDARSTAIVLHSMVAHNGMCSATLY